MALNQNDWGALMRQYHLAGSECDKARRSRQSDLARRFQAEEDSLKRRYFNALPTVTMGVCPYDGIAVERKFDPFGFEGLWWENPPAAQDPPSCIHFVAVRGAVSFQGKTPPGRGSTAEAYIGPDAPYVIPRLLKMDGMVAVIGELQMEPGYLAYPITYFGDPLPAPEDRVPNWGCDQFSYVKANGDRAWRIDLDPWDFALLPWLVSRKLRWCVPGSDNRVLASEPPGRCPYIGLPGHHQAQMIGERGAWLKGTPDGDPGEPIDV